MPCRRLSLLRAAVRRTYGGEEKSNSRLNSLVPCCSLSLAPIVGAEPENAKHVFGLCCLCVSVHVWSVHGDTNAVCTQSVCYVLHQVFS